MNEYYHTVSANRFQRPEPKLAVPVNSATAIHIIS